MATTTTIYADKDNWIYESSPTAQYGAGGNLKIGIGGVFKKLTGIFEFDVSAITKPSDVVSAIFSLTESSSTGSVQNTMTLARLSQDFTESTSNWNTYDGSNAWASAGAEGDAELTEQTYTFNVKAGDISVDIKELVVDAINKRSGVLRFICFYNGTPSSSGYSTFDSRTNILGNPPNVAVTVAGRVVWEGTQDGNLSNYRNWSTLSVPTSDDYALFASGGVSATRGSLTCDKCFVGKEYMGDIRDADGTSISIDCKEIVLNSPRSEWNLEINEAVSGEGCSILIGDTSGKPESSKIEGGVGTSGTYTLVVRKTRSLLEINSVTLDQIDIHGGARVIMANAADVRSTGSILTFSGGGETCIFADGSSVYFSDDGNNKGFLTIAGKSSITVFAAELEDVTIYSGRVGFSGNDNAPITVGNMAVYSKGTLNTTTDSTTFELGAGDNITNYGGSVLFDPSTEIDIE